MTINRKKVIIKTNVIKKETKNNLKIKKIVELKFNRIRRANIS